MVIPVLGVGVNLGVEEDGGLGVVGVGVVVVGDGVGFVFGPGVVRAVALWAVGCPW